MSVSVVLVTYGRAQVLAATIESILGQTMGDFELIISDDCSEDDTEAVCRRFVAEDGRVHYRRNTRRLGMPGNLNAALREASGSLVANLHDGDIYDSCLLEHWRRALDRCSHAAFVFNAYRELSVDGSERTIRRTNVPDCFPGRMLLEDVYFRRWRFTSPVWGTVMARRAAYEAAGPFDERFGFYADVDMWMRLADRYSIAYVDEPLISLPSRDVVPRLFTLSSSEELRILRQIFWAARLRHYQHKPTALLSEAVRHATFTLAAVGTQRALDCRRALRSRLSQGGRGLG